MDNDTEYERTKEYLKGKLPMYLRSKSININGHFKCLNPDHNDHGRSMHYEKQSHTVYCPKCNARYDIFDIAGIDYDLKTVDQRYKKIHEMYIGPVPDEQLKDEDYEADTWGSNRNSNGFASSNFVQDPMDQNPFQHARMAAYSHRDHSQFTNQLLPNPLDTLTSSRRGARPLKGADNFGNGFGNNLVPDLDLSGMPIPQPAPKAGGMVVSIDQNGHVTEHPVSGAPSANKSSDAKNPARFPYIEDNAADDMEGITAVTVSDAAEAKQNAGKKRFEQIPSQIAAHFSALDLNKRNANQDRLRTLGTEPDFNGQLIDPPSSDQRLEPTFTKMPHNLEQGSGNSFRSDSKFKSEPNFNVQPPSNGLANKTKNFFAAANSIHSEQDVIGNSSNFPELPQAVEQANHAQFKPIAKGAENKAKATPNFFATAQASSQSSTQRSNQGANQANQSSNQAANANIQAFERSDLGGLGNSFGAHGSNFGGQGNNSGRDFEGGFRSGFESVGSGMGNDKASNQDHSNAQTQTSYGAKLGYPAHMSEKVDKRYAQIWSEHDEANRQKKAAAAQAAEESKMRRQRDEEFYKKVNQSNFPTFNKNSQLSNLLEDDSPYLSPSQNIKDFEQAKAQRLAEAQALNETQFVSGNVEHDLPDTLKAKLQNKGVPSSLSLSEIASGKVAPSSNQAYPNQAYHEQTNQEQAYHEQASQERDYGYAKPRANALDSNQDLRPSTAISRSNGQGNTAAYPSAQPYSNSTAVEINPIAGMVNKLNGTSNGSNNNGNSRLSKGATTASLNTSTPPKDWTNVFGNDELRLLNPTAPSTLINGRSYDFEKMDEQTLRNNIEKNLAEDTARINAKNAKTQGSLYATAQGRPDKPSTHIYGSAVSGLQQHQQDDTLAAPRPSASDPYSVNNAKHPSSKLAAEVAAHSTGQLGESTVIDTTLGLGANGVTNGAVNGSIGVTNGNASTGTSLSSLVAASMAAKQNANNTNPSNGNLATTGNMSAAANISAATGISGTLRNPNATNKDNQEVSTLIQRSTNTNARFGIESTPGLAQRISEQIQRENSLKKNHKEGTTRIVGTITKVEQNNANDEMHTRITVSDHRTVPMQDKLPPLDTSNPYSTTIFSGALKDQLMPQRKNNEPQKKAHRGPRIDFSNTKHEPSTTFTTETNHITQIDLTQMDIERVSSLNAQANKQDKPVEKHSTPLNFYARAQDAVDNPQLAKNTILVDQFPSELPLPRSSSDNKDNQDKENPDELTKALEKTTAALTAMVTLKATSDSFDKDLEKLGLKTKEDKPSKNAKGSDNHMFKELKSSLDNLDQYLASGGKGHDLKSEKGDFHGFSEHKSSASFLGSESKEKSLKHGFESLDSQTSLGGLESLASQDNTAKGQSSLMQGKELSTGNDTIGTANVSKDEPASLFETLHAKVQDKPFDSSHNVATKDESSDGIQVVLKSDLAASVGENQSITNAAITNPQNSNEALQASATTNGNGIEIVNGKDSAAISVITSGTAQPDAATNTPDAIKAQSSSIDTNAEISALATADSSANTIANAATSEAHATNTNVDGAANPNVDSATKQKADSANNALSSANDLSSANNLNAANTANADAFEADDELFVTGNTSRPEPIASTDVNVAKSNDGITEVKVVPNLTPEEMLLQQGIMPQPFTNAAQLAPNGMQGMSGNAMPLATPMMPGAQPFNPMFDPMQDQTGMGMANMANMGNLSMANLNNPMLNPMGAMPDMLGMQAMPGMPGMQGMPNMGGLPMGMMPNAPMGDMMGNPMLDPAVMFNPAVSNPLMTQQMPPLQGQVLAPVQGQITDPVQGQMLGQGMSLVQGQVPAQALTPNQALTQNQEQALSNAQAQTSALTTAQEQAPSQYPPQAVVPSQEPKLESNLAQNTDVDAAKSTEQQCMMFWVQKKGLSAEVVGRFHLGFLEHMQVADQTWQVGVIPLGENCQQLINTQTDQILMLGHNVPCFNLAALNQSEDSLTNTIFVVSSPLDALSLESLGAHAIALTSPDNTKVFLEYLHENLQQTQAFYIALEHNDTWREVNAHLSRGLNSLQLPFKQINLAAPYDTINIALCRNRSDLLNRLQSPEVLNSLVISPSGQAQEVSATQVESAPIQSTATNSINQFPLLEVFAPMKDSGLILSTESLAKLQLANVLYTMTSSNVAVSRLVLSSVILNQEPILFAGSKTQWQMLCNRLAALPVGGILNNNQGTMIVGTPEATSDMASGIAPHPCKARLVELPLEFDTKSLLITLTQAVMTARNTLANFANLRLMLDTYSFEERFCAALAPLLAELALSLNLPIMVWCTNKQKCYFEGQSIQTIEMTNGMDNEIVFNTFDQDCHRHTFRSQPR